MSEFRDQVVLITGATGGLGEIVTRQFLDAGAHIVGVATEWPSTPDSQRVTALNLDLVDPAQCRQAVTETLSRHKRIDHLIHLVGGYASGMTIAETTDEVWQNMMAINLNSTFNLSREVLPQMLKQKRGRIIAIGSKAGRNPVPSLGAYHVSKAAMHALVRSIASECKGTGVTANVILPSIINTASNRASMPNADHGKWVRPSAIAHLIRYLASDSASEINGSLIPIYGQV